MLECSGNKSPSSYIEDANKLAAEKGYDVNGENPRILYWGGLTYSVQFGEQMREKGIAIHLPTGVITQVPEKIDLQIDNDQARIEWNKLDLLLNNKGSTESTRGTVIISDVPAWWQDSYNGGVGDDGDDEEAEYPDCAGPYDDPWDAWDGCSPISGAMIHGYWSLMGYDEIPYAEEWLIDDNHYYMDTDDFGYTWPTDIDDGIRYVFEYLYGYEDCFEVNNTTGTNWNDITSQVNAGNPAVMSFLGGDLGGHSSTLVGYQDNPGDDYIILHDTWGSTDHYLKYGNWTICQMTKVEESLRGARGNGRILIRPFPLRLLNTLFLFPIIIKKELKQHESIF